MDWTKILNKGWINVAQAFIIIILSGCLITCNWAGNGSSTEIGESRTDIDNLGEQLDRLEEYSKSSIDLINKVIDSNDIITGGLDKLESENKFSRDITEELRRNNLNDTKRIREIQDTLTENELTTDGIRQVISRIEKDNGFSEEN